MNTVTCTVPAVTRSLAGMAALSWVVLTNVVVRLLPFQRTVEAGTKPLPVTVSVKAGPPWSALLGASDESTGTGLELATVTVTAALVPVLPAASVAFTVSVCVPLGTSAVFQTSEYTGGAKMPIKAPST